MQLSFLITAQNLRTIDSLSTILSSTKEDTMRVRTLIGISKEYQGFNSDKAFDLGNKALFISEKIKYNKGLGNSHNNLGDLYWYKSDFAASSEHYFKALKIFEESNNKTAIAACYRNIGWIYFNQNNYPLALQYYFKSLDINLALKNKLEIGQNYNDIAIINIHSKHYNEAIDYLQKSLAIQTELKNKEGIVANYGNLALVYEGMGKTDLAAENIIKSAKIAEEIGSKQHLAISYCNLGALYAKTGKFDLAVQTLNKALEFAKEIKYKQSISDCYENFAMLYYKKKDFQKAYLYADSVSSMKDSIFDEDANRQVNEMTIKYETEKKECMINSLEKDKALSEQKFTQEKNFKIFLVCFCIMIAGFAFILLRGNLEKKKANDALSHAYKEIEVKNKDITDSISYSKRIQEACLPPKEMKYELFPDSFILSKPKDIVSGDFYWFTEKNGKRLIAVCDCTGHGVPGALMSMIGNNFLNQIVNEKGITDVAEILNALHLEVRKALKQHEHPESRDGMDIALIGFNSETEIEYAGAHRPLWIIKSNVLQEIKPDRYSIGGLQTENERIFKKINISFSKEDTIYLFSDGYTDQFGGTNGKKFTTKNFKDLLMNIHTDPMPMQEAVIDQTIEKWKGNREQVDDILVIGIRV
jgi:serine phosphatase RsbU (regulator of sigma subunit)/tetratricopeptide (TPR) repeat protein